MIFSIVAVSLTLSAVVYLYFKWCYSYWDKQNLPTLEPSIPFGNMENPLTQKLTIGPILKQFYHEFKSRGVKHGGLYHLSSPVYMPISPDLVKTIMQVDFQNFVDRGRYYNEKSNRLTAHLFNVGGIKWRNLRTKLTPTFTSGKMKMMFETLVQCGDQMKQAMDGLAGKDDPIDIKDIVARFTTDIIGSCAFGLECNSFKDPNAEFRVHGKEIFAAPTTLGAIVEFISIAKPEWMDAVGITLLGEKQRKFYMNVIEQTVKYREENNVTRNDALQLLIELKNNKLEKTMDGKSLTIEEVAAQALVFFTAGFETSSTTMCFCLFELAQNEEIQERLRQDILGVLENHNGKVTYDSIKEMKYLEQVVDETLRKYPPLPFVSRRCVKEYTVPNTNVKIEKGTMVYIPIMGLQHDEEYFPEPEKFDPERFSETNRKKIKPFTYLPFGEGPRVCIGLRFGMMQVKLGLITLLRHYEFTMNNKTDLPLNLQCYSITLTNDKEIWLDAKKI